MRSSEVRPRHVLSAYAVVAAAGFIVGLGAALYTSGEGLPQGTPCDSVLDTALVAGVAAGSLYLAVVAWMPVAPAARNAVFALLAFVVVSAVGAAALPAHHQGGEALVCLVASSLALASLFPLALRGVRGVLAGPAPATVSNAPLFSSLLALAIIVALFLAYKRDAFERIAGGPAAVPLAGALLVVIALSECAWLYGTRPREERPGWFAPAGRAAIVLILALSAAAHVLAWR